jgi:hypothetical protein
VPARSLDPRLLALYLIAVAVGVFFLPAWWMVAIAAGTQAALWLAVGLGIGPLLRQLRKLAFFCAFLLICYALFSEDPATDRWRTVSVFGWFDLDLNLSGIETGGAMVLRVITVVLASQVIRAGDPKAFAAGLGKLGMPRKVSEALDAVLELMGERGRGGGGGGGGGGGRGGGMRRLVKGDISVVAEKLQGQIARAKERVTDPDVAIIAGIALTMLGVKALKFFPGLPFAPGHKGVVLIPLYIVAGALTRSRFGSTLTGLVMGTVAFLMGDGRYGIFEIAKHVAPGLLVDLLLPLMGDLRKRGVVAWSLFGLVVALGRFATVTVIALAVQPPAIVFAFLLPGLAIHATFGVLSGILTVPLLRALNKDP